MPRTPEQFREIREKTKRQILEAGLKVFATKGYHGASIADIAKEAGVSKGLAYNYFGSKKDLAEAVLLRIGAVLSDFDKMFEEIKDPYEMLAMTIKFTIRNVKENEVFWRLYISFVTQLEVAEIAKKVFGQLMDNYISQFVKIFKRIGVKNPKAEAFILGSILDGVSLDYLFDKENYPIKSVERRLLKKYSREELSK